eukprot:UN09490
MSTYKKAETQDIELVVNQDMTGIHLNNIISNESTSNSNHIIKSISIEIDSSDIGSSDERQNDSKCDISKLTWNQTRLPNLILYAYLFWWIFVMGAFGIYYIQFDAWITAAILASFVCVLLNAAAYQPPACGKY